VSARPELVETGVPTRSSRTGWGPFIRMDMLVIVTRALRFAIGHRRQGFHRLSPFGVGYGSGKRDEERSNDETKEREKSSGRGNGRSKVMYKMMERVLADIATFSKLPMVALLSYKGRGESADRRHVGACMPLA
jgi:hypothetical protein